MLKVAGVHDAVKLKIHLSIILTLGYLLKNSSYFDDPFIKGKNKYPSIIILR